jgi:uncharacterized zinc-type alcohol dehydrogenase-like protein
MIIHNSLINIGPVFCAGITLYDPLKHWGALNGGLKIAIAGFGGLGLMVLFLLFNI